MPVANVPHGMWFIVGGMFFGLEAAAGDCSSHDGFGGTGCGWEGGGGATVEGIVVEISSSCHV